MGRHRKRESIYLKESPSYDAIRATLDRDGHCAIRFYERPSGVPGQVAPWMYKAGDVLEIYFKDRGNDIVRHVMIIAKQNGFEGMTTLIFKLLKK